MPIVRSFSSSSLFAYASVTINLSFLAVLLSFLLTFIVKQCSGEGESSFVKLSSDGAWTDIFGNPARCFWPTSSIQNHEKATRQVCYHLASAPQLHYNRKHIENSWKMPPKITICQDVKRAPFWYLRGICYSLIGLLTTARLWSTRHSDLPPKTDDGHLIFYSCLLSTWVLTFLLSLFCFLIFYQWF